MHLFQALITLFLLSIVIFGLARISGDPTLLMLPDAASREDRDRLRHMLGLDKPIHVQYKVFLVNALKGDFGSSNRSRKPVMELLQQRLPNSMKLAGVSFLMALVLGIGLGVMAAVKRHSFLDSFAQVTAAIGQAIPAFWLGLVLMLIFAVRLRLLPTSGMTDWRSYLMPAFCLSLFVMAGMIRLVRSSMLDVLDSEYIKMARIKGVSDRAVIWKHALRNSLLPLVSFGGVYFALLVTSAIVVETVFSWPGIGTLTFDALMYRDFPVIQGVILTAGAIVIATNLLVDVLYAYIDPRIRYH